MNEPLINSHPGISFCGKSHNKHPHWYNQPLRLTEEQLDNPLLILDDFFQTYHLNETREVLWQWLTAIISSPGSISSEPLERSNHIYFYEKVESVIEAAYVLRTNQPTDLDSQSKGNVISTQPGQLPPTEGPNEISNKEKQLIEYVDNNPLYVIHEVFKNESLSLIRDQLRDWLLVAISADTAIYEDGEQRKQLLFFQDHLLLLIEVLFVIHSQNRGVVSITGANKTKLISQAQKVNPMPVITEFFQKFPSLYCIRELNDWLEAGIAYGGDYPDNMSELQVLLTYRNVLCLIKSAEQFLKPEYLTLITSEE